jgi:hypothetical protein
LNSSVTLGARVSPAMSSRFRRDRLPVVRSDLTNDATP